MANDDNELDFETTVTMQMPEAEQQKAALFLKQCGKITCNYVSGIRVIFNASESELAAKEGQIREAVSKILPDQNEFADDGCEASKTNGRYEFRLLSRDKLSDKAKAALDNARSMIDSV